ncbi:MAG: hypothetical protein LBB17_03435 [Puniceicoccales bacterium]|nr:hypothetical protein [Puniceicoccales bacterium]
MDGVNAATSYGVGIRREILLLKNSKRAGTTSLHGSEDISDHLPFRNGKNATMLPCLISSRDAVTLVPRADPRQILENGVRRAFFGMTDNIDDGRWDDVRTRLMTVTLGEARKIWQTVANEIAADCFDADGRVDVGKLREWMVFLGNEENFDDDDEPFSLIPHDRFMRSQICMVCECLLDNRNGAMDELNTASGITPVGPHGQAILDIMSQYGESPLNPAVAILASLFTPHRQLSLPACTIHSIFNAEIRNHPKRLIKTYVQIFEGDQFTFPSGYAVKQQPIENGFITVDLINGGDGSLAVFRDIFCGDPKKINQQKERWRQEGIKYEYVEPTTDADEDEDKSRVLKLPVHNMNDVFFAHFLQVSNFGNGDMGDNETYGTMPVYAGHGKDTMYSSIIQVDGSNLSDVIAKLKEQAEAQQKLGHHYMRIATETPTGSHAENIDIAALLALDPNSMKIGQAYPIGDRNRCDDDMSQNIPRLAIRVKKQGSLVYEFGTLEKFGFEKDDISSIKVYTTDIEERDAAYWKWK